VRDSEERTAWTLTFNVVHATILELHAAPNGRLANRQLEAPNGFDFGPRQREKNMEHAIRQRRTIGLLIIFATVLTVIAAWNLPETRDHSD